MLDTKVSEVISETTVFVSHLESVQATGIASPNLVKLFYKTLHQISQNLP
jgi:hypothetical protein